MWGHNTIGFGTTHYKYPSDREGDMPLIGFAPRKQALTIYLTQGVDQYTTLLTQLGKYRTGRICLYINKLADVDLKVLKEVLRQSFQDAKKHPKTQSYQAKNRKK
jgi:uncharacterized protein YdhG (YjbR/CyaY superfamily)